MCKGIINTKKGTEVNILETSETSPQSTGGNDKQLYD